MCSRVVTLRVLGFLLVCEHVSDNFLGSKSQDASQDDRG